MKKTNKIKIIMVVRERKRINSIMLSGIIWKNKQNDQWRTKGASQGLWTEAGSHKVFTVASIWSHIYWYSSEQSCLQSTICMWHLSLPLISSALSRRENSPQVLQVWFPRLTSPKKRNLSSKNQRRILEILGFLVRIFV